MTSLMLIFCLIELMTKMAQNYSYKLYMCNTDKKKSIIFYLIPLVMSGETYSQWVYYSKNRFYFVVQEMYSEN